MRQVMRLVLLAAFAAACAQVEVKPPEGALDFSLAGRIAVRSGSEAFTGNIAWRHAKGGDEILLSTPTGQGVAQILRQGDAVLLKTAEGKEYRAVDSESLTERVLGFRLPIGGLA
jgi:outer membrane lipoprotein LolB